MNRIRKFVGLLLFAALPSFAYAGTTELRVLFDTDSDATTGCTVGGMEGVEQVLVTQISDDDSTPRVTRTHRQVCSANALGAPVDVVTSSWPAKWRESDRQLTVETRLPFTAFGSDGIPSGIHVAFDATRNTNVHSALANADGTPAILPEISRRRAAGAPGRTIVMDGVLSDWGMISPILFGIQDGGSTALRLVRILAYANTDDNFLYFAADLRVSSASPFADEDTYQRNPGEGLSVNTPGVLQNDGDPNGQPLTALKISEAEKGTVTLNPDGSFTYTPNNPHSNGTDQFEYKATTGDEDSNVARVRIKVNTGESPQDGPEDDLYDTDEDTTLNVPAAQGVLANDPPGNAGTATLVTPPSHGTVVLNANGGFVYKPANNFFGIDTFVYSLSVGNSPLGGNATVTIEVESVNDSPSLQPATFSIPENSPNGTPVGTVTFGDSDGDDVTLSITSGNTGGAFTINASTGAISVANSAALDFETTPTFSLTVKAQDNGTPSKSTTQIITINLTNAPEPPVITLSGTTLTYTENDPPSIIDGSLTVSDPDSAQLTGASVSISGNFAAGQDVLSFTPVGAITGVFSGNTLTLSGNDTPANYQTALRSVRYQNTSENPSVAPRTITWTVTDGTFTSNPVNSTVNVIAVNDAPVNAVPGAQATNEDTALTFSTGNGNAISISDVDGSSSVVTLAATNGTITASAGATIIGNGTANVQLSGTNAAINTSLEGLVFNPTANYNGAAQISMTTNDQGNTGTGGAQSDVDVIAITVLAVNDQPVVNPATFSLPENSANGTNVGTPVTFTDPDAGQTHTFAITAGNTGGAFAINTSTGQITVANQAALDFETNPTFSLTVTVTDDSGAGNATGSATITVNLTNVNEAPTDIALSNDTVAENQPSGTAIGNFSTTDQDAGDTFTYTLVAGAGDTGNGSFQIVGNQLQTSASFDFEAQPSYSIRVRSTDSGGLFLEEVFTITVTNVNDAPTDIALSNATAQENQAIGTTIGTFSTTDQDVGDTFTYTLVAGTGDADNAKFQIVGNALQNAVNLDFETQPSYSILVRSTDSGGLFFEEVFTITLTNVNETPTDIALSNTSVNENQPSGTAVGNFSTTDVDAGDTFTYTLVAGTGDTGNASFQIVGNQLQTSAMFDFEAQNSYSIRVRSTDAGGLFVEEVFTISVNNVNEAPTDIALSANTVAENQPIGTAVGNFSTTDVDASDTFTYTLVAGAGDTGNASFQIVGNQLQTSAMFDFEAQNSYSIRVRSTDAGGLFFEEVFTISVTNGNETPTDIQLSNASAPENQPVGTDIGTLTTTDPDAGDTFTYTLVAGTGDTDNGSFQIVGDKLQNATNLDFDAQAVYSVRVRSTDAGGLFFEEVFAITITNVNETPTDIALSNASVAENQPSGTAVGNFSTIDPDAGDTFTYTLVAGTGDTGNGSFQIVGSQLQTSATFNFEVQNSYSIRVRSTDAGGLFFEEVFTITVTNVNEAPTDIALSNATIAENQPSGTAVGTFSTTDVDAGDTFTYTLVAGAGDTGNGSFQIVGGQLQTSAAFDFETQNSYSIRVRSTDAGGLFFEEVFTITVTNVNEAPTDIALSNATAPENQAIGTTIGTFSTTDQDVGDTFTYTLVAGTGDADNAKFQIVGNALQNAVNLDFDTQPSYSIRVRSTDAGSLFYEEVFTITITNVNETPTDIALSNASVNENQASGAAVGNFSTTDPDAGDTFTYTLVAGTGDTGNGSFQIGGNQLQTSATFNFEAQNSYSIRVRSTDAGGLFYEEVFTISVNNLNEAPTDIALSNATAPENQPVGTDIGTFTTTDPDTGDTFTYTLVAGAGDTDNASFQIAGDKLQNATNLNFEAQSSYSIRVRSTDAGGLFFEEVFTITITNANETPTDINLSNASTPENQPVGTDIGTLTTTDPDAGDTFTYTLVAGTGDTDNASFQIVGDKLQNATNLNFEAQATYSVRLRTTDAGGLFYEEVFTITVTDANDSPTALNLSNNTVAENQPSGTVVGTFTTTDQEGGQTHTYTLVAGTGDTDNGSFQIVGNQLQTSASFNFEAQSSYSIRVRTTDDGVPTGFFEQVFTITVTNVNEAPTDIALSNASVAENQPSATPVGTFSTTDPDTGDTFTYTLVAGAGDTGNGSFQIVGNQLQTSASFNFEAQNSYSIRVRSTDAGGLFFEEVFTITVTNVNETPTDIALSNASINENSGVNAVIGTLSTTDPDSPDTHTYTLVAGVGDTNNGLFNINGNQLRETASLNFEAGSSYSVRIRTTDAGGLFYEEAFTITVVDVNEAPTAIADTYNAVGGTLVHITGGVTLPVPAPVASTGDVHPTPRTTGVKANDTDPDTNPSFNTLTVTSVTGSATVPVPGGGQATTTTANGSLTMHSDGSFHYTPNAGFLGTDNYTYNIFDGANNASGNLSFTVHAPAIRYVKNDVLVAGNGTSVSPHQTLAAAITASTAGELIYVMRGDGTATNYGGSNVMKLNQSLWGQGVALSVTANTVPLNLIAASSHSLIGPDAGANEVIRIQNGITGIDVQGLSINGGTTNALDVTTSGGANNAGVSFSNNIITAATLEGIDVNHASGGNVIVAVQNNTITTTGNGFDYARTSTGTGTIVFSNNAVTSAGTGVNISGGAAASTTITGFANNTISGATGGTGINILNSTFDAVAGGSFNLVNAGATNVGQSGNGVGGSGIVLTLVAGDLSFSTLNIYADNGSGLSATSTTAYTGSAGLQLTAIGGTGVIQATNGPAVSLTTVTANLVLSQVVSTNSTGNGVNLTSVIGTFTVGGTSVITNATSADFFISTSSVNVTYPGTITDDQGQLMTISSNTGTRTILFSGAITDGDDGDGTGITMSGNSAGTTVRFSGGLVLSTGSAAALSVSGGGILEICDESGCNINATGALVNKITTTTGTAVNITSTTIGAAGVELRSVSSNGAPSGIILNNTGAGAFKVRGNSAGNCGGTVTGYVLGTPATVGAPVTADCTGGTIQASTSHGIQLTNVDGVSLTRMYILNSGGDGILASDVNGFTLDRSYITDAAGAAGDRGIEMGDFSTGTPINGAVTVSNSTIGPTPHDNFGSGIASGTSTWSITNTVFTGSVLNSGLNWEIRNATVSSFTIDNSVFQNHFADGMQMQPASNVTTATVTNATIQNSTFQNNNIGMDLNHDGVANLTYNVLSNTFRGHAGQPINLFSSAVQAPTTGGTLEATMDNNRIGLAGSFASGSAVGNGIRVNINGGAGATVLLSNNVIRETPNARGIEVISRNGTGGLDITITNNNVNPDYVATVQNGGFSLSAIFLQSNCLSVCNTLRSDVRSNTVPAFAPTGELVAGQLVLIETGASALQLVDTTAPISGTCASELAGTNTGNTNANAGCSLIAGPITTP